MCCPDMQNKQHCMNLAMPCSLPHRNDRPQALPGFSTSMSVCQCVTPQRTYKPCRNYDMGGVCSLAGCLHHSPTAKQHASAMGFMFHASELHPKPVTTFIKLSSGSCSRRMGLLYKTPASKQTPPVFNVNDVQEGGCAFYTGQGQPHKVDDCLSHC